VVIPSGKRARLCRTHQPAPLAEERRIKIQCDLGPAKTFGDADRLGQLITNLLTNAIYYNKPSGEIRVSTRSENGGAVLAVADSGEGIAVKIFPMFLSVSIGPISRAPVPQAAAAWVWLFAKPSWTATAAAST
jgi:light-regulated signal transduction histidine kinase (bacteriophytochrome)